MTMKPHYLPLSWCFLLGASLLGCSSDEGDVMLGNDGNAGTTSAGSDSGGKSSGGAANGGTSSNAGNTSAGTQNGGSSGAAGSTGYQPCAGKACGDVCSICDPNSSACKPAPGTATCTALGQCSVGRPDCSTTPQCEDGTQYYQAGCSSVARPGGEPVPPLVPGCYATCNAATAIAPAKLCGAGFYCATTWYDPSADCVPGEACAAACGATIELCFPIMQ
jgi:hypothetical protein